jgi:putative heme-binding domain-containing protein
MNLTQRLVCLAGLVVVPAMQVQAQDPPQPKVYTQAVEKVASTGTEPATPGESSEKTPEGGAVPQWIWGAESGKNYVVKKTFTGPVKKAVLQLTCDNGFVAKFNGQEVAKGNEWAQSSKVDITKQVVDGENTLLVNAFNEGGVAAFIARITLIRNDGSTEFLSTDDSWGVAEKADAAEWAKPKIIGKLGDSPWGDPFSEGAVGTAKFNTLPGFQVERLFTVPKDELGSWVCIAFDNKGRLIASDQGDKGLCRITLPALGSADPVKVEKLTVDISAAQGLLYAFDALYVSVNGGKGSGFYRCKDTNGDDQFDEVVKLFEFRGGGEHGPHALHLSPDGKSIYVICGNHTRPPFEPADLPNKPEEERARYTSRLPLNWNEDHILPRQWDANGHAVGILAPGGWIAKTDPEGKTWEVVSAGYRNPYDMAFNADGELFAYDADMEWDFGAPWYRPTRVSHAVSGSEFGWRSGTGKWPSHYVDSLPELVNIGPGCPVGVAFGYGTKFPAKYQNALYICDWTFGTMYAIHIQPRGASYTATKEEFVSRTPLPLTDVAVAPDGTLCFTVGGRGTQSELFRVVYTGTEPTEPAIAKNTTTVAMHDLRHQLEAFHSKQADPKPAVELAFPNLNHPDRFIRYAARIALEHQPAEGWRDMVLGSTAPNQLINGVAGLARVGGDAALRHRLVESLDKLTWATLTPTQRLELLRTYQLIFVRLGEPEEADRLMVLKKLDERFPATQLPGGNDAHAQLELNDLNRELANVLVYLKAPGISTRIAALLAAPPQQIAPEYGELLSRNAGYGGTLLAVQKNHPDVMQMHYAFALRNLKTGWTIEDRKVFFNWFNTARTWSGGASYQGFLRNIDKEAWENASEQEKLAIEAFGARKPVLPPELPKAAGPGQDWTVDSILAAAGPELKGRDFENGKKMFAAGRCILCHRYDAEGGATGPDLTQLAGRFALKDMAEAVVDPNKVVPDLFRATVIETKSGQVYTGRIASENADSVTIITNPEDATKFQTIPISEIETRTVSMTSQMPKDLLKSLNQDEVLDLMAYLLSRGNKNAPMFKK